LTEIKLTVKFLSVNIHATEKPTAYSNTAQLGRGSLWNRLGQPAFCNLFFLKLSIYTHSFYTAHLSYISENKYTFLDHSNNSGIKVQLIQIHFLNGLTTRMFIISQGQTRQWSQIPRCLLSTQTTCGEASAHPQCGCLSLRAGRTIS
jgi:hypothetical protein